ncbi:MAG: hypothetical protein OIF55_16050 [Amphritea sp.]|nr:hypothetical protein [Amphritea sp.]
MHSRRLRYRLRDFLIRRADNVQQNFRIMLVGGGLFLVGFLTLGITEFLFRSSLTQELFALAGLILAVIGVIITAFGYISLSILRIFRFLLTDTQQDKD